MKARCDVRSKARLLAFAGAIIGGAGCGAGDVADRPAHERRDSAGVEIVTSRAPAWTDGARWRLSVAPVLEIGEAEGDAPYLLSRVAGAVRLPDGRIVVGDGGSNQLRFYDAAGAFLDAAGRSGEGPGEFAYLRALRRCRPDSLFAFDLSWQLSVFDLSGRFARRIRLTMPGTQRTPYRLSCDEAGRLVLTGWGRETLGPPIIGYYRTHARTVLTTTDGALLHDFGELPAAERIGSEHGSRPHPFGKAIIHAIGGGRVHLGTADAYEIRIFGLDGTLRRILRWAGPDLALTPEHIAAYRERVLAGADPARRPAFERELRDMPFPETIPAYTDFRLDPDGNLWVQSFRPPGTAAQIWSVFSPDGILLGDVAMPPDFEVTGIGRESVLGVATDDLDVERVRLYGLIRPGVSAGERGP